MNTQPPHELKLQSKSYPYLLSQISGPPEQLYSLGDLSLLNKPCLAIVGTRRYSEYGRYLTEKIIRELAPYQVVIVSGLAHGIDTFAHKFALKYGLKTIAVLGCGFEKIYPKQNISLFHEIAEKGLVLSEYAPDTEVQSYFFPQRNRIISGISLGTLMVEAPEKSGAMITSKFALDQGREIFTIPGDIDRINSLGALQLLQRHGAYPIASGKEIVEILGKQSPLPFATNNAFLSQKASPTSGKTPATSMLTFERQLILNCLTRGRGKSLEELHVKSKISITELLTLISFMEVEDLICTRSGKYFRSC